MQSIRPLLAADFVGKVHQMNLDAFENVLLDKSKCDMEKCFDLSLCRKHGFSIYVYPKQEDINGKISKLFADVIDSIKRSHYITTDPDRACIKGKQFICLLYKSFY